MGPLEKGYKSRDVSYSEEIMLLWRHLDAMSAKPVTEPHAEALRVAVEALEEFKSSIEPTETELAEMALARIKEIMGDVK